MKKNLFTIWFWFMYGFAMAYILFKAVFIGILFYLYWVGALGFVFTLGAYFIMGFASLLSLYYFVIPSLRMIAQETGSKHHKKLISVFDPVVRFAECVGLIPQKWFNQQ